jgi:colanic acid/amylovoran biosynthesis glycosyltransferase
MLAIAYPSAQPQFSETFISDQIELLRADGMPVLELAGGYLPYIMRDESETQTLLSPDLHSLIGSGFPEFGLRQRLENRLANELTQRGIKAVLAHYGPTGLGMLPVCRKAGIPLLVWFHGYDVWRGAERKRYLKAYKTLVKEAACMFTSSLAIRDELIAWGADAEKVRHLPCGARLEFFPPIAAYPPAGPTTFLFAARFAPTKDWRTLISAFINVRKELSPARLILAGKGPEVDWARTTVEKLEIDTHTMMPGSVTRKQLYGLMKQATAYVLPSQTAKDGDAEGTPVGLLEAAAAGVPIISTVHQGIAEVFTHGEHALLVPERKPHLLADALLDVAHYPAAARTRAENAQKLVREHYSIDHSQAALREALRPYGL